MLTPFYGDLRLFQDNFSQIANISEAIAFIKKDLNLDLSLQITSLPLDLSHDLTTDSLTGSGQITLLPKLYVCGELFECRPCHMLMPPSFGELEAAYLKTLKESLSTAGRVWS